MKVEELRVGNWINWKGGDAPDEGYNSIFEIADFSLIKSKPHQFRPIKLTKEWLIRFGFEVENNEEYDNTLYYKGIFGLLRDEIYSTNSEFLYPILVRYGNPWEFKSGIVIKYVHQLQNLYFATRQEELEIVKNE